MQRSADSALAEWTSGVEKSITQATADIQKATEDDLKSRIRILAIVGVNIVLFLAIAKLNLAVRVAVDLDH